MKTTTCPKVFLISACLVGLVSGCDKKGIWELGEAEDFIKSAPPADQQIIHDFYSQKPENILNEGIINLRAGEREKAIALLEKYTQYYPDSPTGQFYLGQAYYTNNMFEEAITRLKHAYRVDNSNTAVLFYLALSYQETGKKQEAVNALFTYLLSEQEPKNLNRAEEELNSMAEPVKGRYIIDRVFLSDEPQNDDNVFPLPKICFPSNVEEILAEVKVLDAPPGTEIEGIWNYLVSEREKKKISSSVFLSEGSEDITMSFEKPHGGFSAGEYELEIRVDKEKNVIVRFYVF